MLEFVESGTTVLFSELTTLVSISSSDHSIEFKICTAPPMLVGKSQTQKICDQHVVFSVSLYKLWGIVITYLFKALIFILFQPAQNSYLASMI
jgi:hypothetical protein